MVELGTYTSASERRFTLGWVGIAIVMSFTIAAVDFLELPLQAVYVLAADVTLREAIGLAVWAPRR